MEDRQERQALGERRTHAVDDNCPALPASGNEPRGRRAERLGNCDRPKPELLGGPWIKRTMAHGQAMRHEKR